MPAPPRLGSRSTNSLPRLPTDSWYSRRLVSFSTDIRYKYTDRQYAAQTQFTFTIPKSLPSGQYLVRAEQVCPEFAKYQRCLLQRFELLTLIGLTIGTDRFTRRFDIWRRSVLHWMRTN